MVKKRILSMALAAAIVFPTLAGCGSSGKEPAQPGNTASASPASTPGKTALKGEITFIHHRTDIDGTLMKGYIAKFNEKYPDIKVKTETMSDYEGQMKIRLNSNDYGDALIVSDEVNKVDLPNFYERLGSATELEKKYMWIRTGRSLGEDVFGIPTCGNAFGIVYNKKVFSDAGITKLPATPDEFIAALKSVKEKTKAIPLYTNYAADWPMQQWEDHRTSVAGNPDYVNSMAHTDDPFSPGKPHYIVYKLMYDAVKEKLVEQDPLTTDWESSKPRMANGEIATMVLGSWAISQIREKAANPADIGYMPFPYTNKDGKIYAGSGGDKNIGINKNSKNKEAARAWLDFFLNETTYAKDLGAISTLKGSPLPDALKAFQDLGVVLITNSPAPAGEDGLVDRIDKESEVGLWQSTFKKRIIEAALGNRKESYDDIMKDLNAKWAKGRKAVVK